MKKEKTIMLMVDDDFKNKVHEQAHNERLSMSEFIRKVLSDYIDSKNGGNK